MNDFTKEELQIILLDMDTYLHKAGGRGILKAPMHHIELRDKINSMIDNYCEHEYSPTEMLNMPLHCLKCGRRFE